MTELVVIILLLLFIIIRELIIWKELQKLVDKIISRDFTEYTSGVRDITVAKKDKKDFDVNQMFKI